MYNLFESSPCSYHEKYCHCERHSWWSGTDYIVLSHLFFPTFEREPAPWASLLAIISINKVDNLPSKPSQERLTKRLNSSNNCITQFEDRIPTFLLNLAGGQHAKGLASPPRTTSSRNHLDYQRQHKKQDNSHHFSLSQREREGEENTTKEEDLDPNTPPKPREEQIRGGSLG
jgi:hypothetical protein